ncbi:hypothetical protein R6Z07F_018053 [Ovis aries]
MGLEGGAQPESTLRNGGSSMARPPAAWWPLRGSQTLSSNTLLLARGRPPPLCWVSASSAVAARGQQLGHTIRDPQPDAAGVSPELQPRVQRRVRPAERPGQVQSSPLLPEGRGALDSQNPFPSQPAQGASSLAWVQQTCAGLSAAAPARVETGLPSHAEAPSSEPGRLLDRGAGVLSSRACELGREQMASLVSSTLTGAQRPFSKSICP